MVLYKIGSPKSEVVKQIQKALHVYPDGIYGEMTRNAVLDFQRSKNLKADGIVGPATLALLIPARLKKSRRNIKYIVIHCTASPADSRHDYTAEDIRKMHKAQGWSDIGYHYVIRFDGTIENGRDVDIVGAHVEGWNKESIGVVYVGGLDVKGKPCDTRTENQKAALLSLLMDLRKLYPKAKISGHRDFSPDKNHDGVISPDEYIKECPCFDAKTEYKKI